MGMFSNYELLDMATLGTRFASCVGEATMQACEQTSRMIGFDGLADVYKAAATSYGRFAQPYPQQAWGIHSTIINGEAVAVSQETLLDKPFGNLIRFNRDTTNVDPNVIVVAPMSGHFATLVKGTVKALIPHNNVHVTDWKNPRDVSLEKHGRFGFDDYIAYLQSFMTAVGGRPHLVAVCQPGIQTLAAASLMAEANHPNRPRSITLMGSPIDTRISETVVNKLAKEHSIDWFRDELTSTVPFWHEGHGRRVYPGMVQLISFMMMNLDKHIKAHVNLFNAVAKGDEAAAEKIKDFYNEYLSVMDLDADFYLETVNRVFIEQLLAKGMLKWRGKTVDPSALKDTGLFTVEGEWDDITGLGQTLAAHDLTPNIPQALKGHKLVPRVGHYGIFAGKRWEEDTAPWVSGNIRAMEHVDNHLKKAGKMPDTGSMPHNLRHITAGVNQPLAVP